MSEQEDKLLNVKQVAEMLQLDPNTVRHWIRTNQLPAINIQPGTVRPVYRIRESTVKALLSKSTATHNLE